MFQTEKREVIVIAAIAVLVILAVVPATAAAATLFADDFQSGNLNKWTVSNHQEAA
jgi:ABC-type transport system involved in cytochrome c biogenesis permease component